MKERPILFSAPMVRAILDGRKTQTRRIVKQKHLPFLENILGNFIDGKWNQRPLPYGKTGDRLWVRETFNINDDGHYIYAADLNDAGVTKWAAKWKPSIHMPRSASRVLLEIVNVRVERLQDISEEDAIAEGLKVCPNMNGRTGSIGYVWPDSPYDKSGLCHSLPVTAFGQGWGIINGPESWDLNPFVWVIEFRTLEIARAAA